MGQKVHPYGFRLGFNKTWRSRWYSDRDYATLQFTRKTIAREIAKVLRSAVANVQQDEAFSGDIDRLYVLAAYANQGPSQKRVRPAPMGRAYRVVKRTAHLTVQVAERPVKIAKVATESDAAAAKPARAKKSADKKPAAAKA